MLWSMKGSMTYNDVEGMTSGERRWFLERVDKQLNRELAAQRKASKRR